MPSSGRSVAPYAGAWIEITSVSAKALPGSSSLPTRERGLKYVPDHGGDQLLLVAPYAGAWIEISQNGKQKPRLSVAPYAGAWIEIAFSDMSLSAAKVAPYAGAWIEIHIDLFVQSIH